MMPFVQDPDFTLYVGDVREVLATLPDESVQCVVTSPPYWGLRDYGTGSWEGGDSDHKHETSPARNGRGGSGGPGKQTEGAFPSQLAVAKCSCGATRTDQQLGLEPTPELYVENMVGVFREVRRVLRRDGTLWLNIGDSYASSLPGISGLERYKSTGLNGGAPRHAETVSATKINTIVGCLKPKDLCGIPWRLAFALQADGWFLRSEIIWLKPNPMPESVTDRPTKAHEQVFLLTRSPRYFYDADAVREPAEWARWGDQTNGKHEGSESGAGWIGAKSKAELQRGRTWAERKENGAPMRHGLDGAAAHSAGGFATPLTGRNLRSVWEIPTQPFAEAHFATYPQALVERCVKAGTSERGCCPECGAPWERDATIAYELDGSGTTGRARDLHEPDGRTNGTGFAGKPKMRKNVTTLGWKLGCDHGSESVACVVLDPFLGSGTTALVARRLGRRCVGIELNEEYAGMAARRLSQLSLLAEEIA